MKTQSVQALIQKYSYKNKRPDNSSYLALMLQDARRIKKETGVALYEIEKEAMENGILPERYSRNQKTFSTEEQLKLHVASVAVVGLGGLGGTVTEILARSGIGNLTLIDGDVFDESNLNRQLLSAPALLGKPKSEAAKERVRTINPAVRITDQQKFLTSDNASALLENVDLAVDCLDNIADRFLLEDGCSKNSIPFVSAAIGGTSGQVTIIQPDEPKLDTIYGPRHQRSSKGIEASMGTPAFTAIFTASIQSAEVVGLILGKPSSLQQSLLLTDIADHTHELVELPQRKP